MRVIIKKKAKKRMVAEMKKEGFEYNEKTFDAMKAKMSAFLEQYSSFFPDKSIFYIEEADGFNANNRPYSNKRFYGISFNWLWMYNLYFHECELLDNALVATLGHELGHCKAAHHIPFFLVTKAITDKTTRKETFLLRTVEVFCDFNGAGLFGGSREDLIEAKKWEYDTSRKYKQFKKDTDYIHPTHESRMEYLEKYEVFCDDLIRKIARDNSYENETVIQKTIEYYEKVKQKNGYVPVLSRLLSIASLLITIFIVIGIPISLSFLIR